MSERKIEAEHTLLDVIDGMLLTSLTVAAGIYHTFDGRRLRDREWSEFLLNIAGVAITLALLTVGGTLGIVGASAVWWAAGIFVGLRALSWILTRNQTS